MQQGGGRVAYYLHCLLLTCLLALPRGTCATSTFQWLHDNITITGSHTTITGDPTAFLLQLRSNRRIVGGGYRLTLVASVHQDLTNSYTSTYLLNTTCIPYHSKPQVIEEQITSLLLRFHQGRFSSPYVPQARVTRRGNASADYNHGYQYKIRGLSYGLFGTNVTMKVWGSGAAVGCDDLLSYGNWTDPSQWDLNKVPGGSDQVVIGKPTGVIALTGPTTVSKLTMSGGTLLLGQTDCGDKWMPSPDQVRNKCFKGFDARINRHDAERACRSYAPQNKGHLARIESHAENHYVRGLCRNKVGEEACWIGLKVDQEQEWGWEEEANMLDITYRSWDWHEPNNLTHPDGYETCSAIQSSTQDPFVQARAVWVDQDCSTPISYICEKRAESNPHTLTVVSSFQWHGGSISGPGNITLNGTSSITAMTGKVTLRDSAWMVNKMYLNITADYMWGIGSTIVNQHILRISNGSAVLKNYQDNKEPYGWPSVLYNSGKGNMIIDVYSGNKAQVDWVFKNYGTVRVNTGSLDLMGSGFSLGGTLSVNGPNAILMANQSFQMMQPAIQLLTVSSPHPVSDVDQSYGQDKGTGVFRLKFGTSSSFTTCLPYHVSPQDLQTALNSLPSINAQGNVTVFRTGRKWDRRWAYGYHHLIVFDRASGYNRTVNTAISLYCSGSKGGCGCVDPAADFLEQGSDRFSCAVPGQNSTATVPSRCTVKPTYTIKILEKGAEQKIVGTGTLSANSSKHLLPSHIGCNNTEIRDGVAYISSRTIKADTMSVYGGRLFLVGTGYDGMDLARLSYDEDETRYARRNALLAYNPPPLYGTIRRLNVYGGTFAVTSMFNDLPVSRLYWTGGALSGRVKLRVQQYGKINGTTCKRLQNGFQLWNMATNLNWDNCGVTLSEGSSFSNAGTLWITGNQAMFITHDPQHVGWYPGRQYDDQGWYTNFLCGDRCTATPFLENIAHGTIKMTANATYRVGIPLFQYGKVSTYGLSKFDIGSGGYNNGTLDISLNSTVRVSQGFFNFSATSNVTNTGTLEVVDGFHRAPSTFKSRVVVRGGTLYFLTNNVHFYSNVSMHGGMMKFTRRQQNITMAASFTLQDGSVVYRDEVHLYRDHRVVNDRANITVVGTMLWQGGMVDGNLNILCQSVLDMDDATKQLAGGAQVVYYGIAYWGTGDIITTEDSTLLHRGELQLKSALNFTARLSHKDTFDGCCPYKQSNGLLQWDE